MRVKSNEVGICPICNNAMLDYGVMECVDNHNGFYPWECTECKTQGEEWFTLDFIGHNVKDEDGDMYEIEDKDLEVQ